VISPATNDSKHDIALTFDDGYANILRHGLRPLADYGFHAIQFLVAGFIGIIKQWDLCTNEVNESLMDAARPPAGHEIGPHKCFCHPYGDWDHATVFIFGLTSTCVLNVAVLIT